MKNFAFCGHKWGYSRPEHIKTLDKWAKGHWRGKLKNAKPMINEGRIEGRRFYHNTKRTISYVQLHKLKFTKFCVSLLRERRLPVPSQDTFMFFVCNRFDPHLAGIKNFKRHHGFTQGNSRRGVVELKNKLDVVESLNSDLPEESFEIDEPENSFDMKSVKSYFDISDNSLKHQKSKMTSIHLQTDDSVKIEIRESK